MPEAARTSDAEPATTEIPTTKQFNTFLQEHRGGGLHNELSEKLAEVVAAVLEQQKKGSLKLTVDITPAQGAAVAVVVTDEVKTSAPRAANPPSLFFSDDHGNLSRRDPRQMEVPGLRDASKK